MHHGASARRCSGAGYVGAGVYVFLRHGLVPERITGNFTWNASSHFEEKLTVIGDSTGHRTTFGGRSPIQAEFPVDPSRHGDRYPITVTTAGEPVGFAIDLSVTFKGRVWYSGPRA
jgi:hypothetical protein